jgi:transposase-like protein
LRPWRGKDSGGVKKIDREQMAEDLKAIYRAEAVEKAEKALDALETRWGKRYPKLVKKWREKSGALLQFLSHPKAIRSYLSTTNQLERMMKEVKRRTKVMEVFRDSAGVEKLFYRVFVELNERLAA